MSESADRRLAVAVVGGGVAGLTAAFALQAVHDVTLYEADDSLGGHAHAVPVDDGFGGTVEVDTAFLIYNDLWYPSFVSLLRRLGVTRHTHSAEMSACFADHDVGLHYALGRGPDALFYQRRNLVDPHFHRIFVELFAFRRRAHRDLETGRLCEETSLGEYLAPYSARFRENLVLPLAMAIWSLPAGDILAYPARAILEFFRNHRLLRGQSGDAWRTFIGGSGRYVRAFERAFRGVLRVRTPVLCVERGPAAVTIVTATDRVRFDKVVLATHADVSLRLLADPTPQEARVLGAWRYHPNLVTLHRDVGVMHQDRRLWASWNVVKRQGRSTVSYHLNRVQRLASCREYFLTLGDADILESQVVRRFRCRHPVFDAPAVASQRELPSLNGRRDTYFCGSYTGHGFHEDAVRSSLLVAGELGAPPL